MNYNQVTVLIPAHNEALNIGKTLTTLLSQLTPRDRIVVVADNCTDETAEIARFIGDNFEKCDVTVLERKDPERLGKGYALDYGLKFLKSDSPSVVVLIDADCIVHSGSLQRLAEVALTSGRPVQATYLQDQPLNPTPKDAISALAILVKNFVRLQGLARLGLPCFLYGTGMAFPWSVISTASLANGNLVEDMQLAIDLAIAGYPPIYCAEAKVTATLPQQQKAIKTQRTRWEQGHLQTLVSQVPRLLKAAISQKRIELLALALDLGVPPLSLLVMLWGVTTAIALLLGILAGAWMPTIVLAITGLLIFTSIVGAWAKFGRKTIPGSVLLAIPVYILWKIPLYIAFIVRPQKKWVRTERDRFCQAKS